MYDQQKMHVTAEDKNPASFVTAGIARIPAPTYVHRKRKVKNRQVTGGLSFCTCRSVGASSYMNLYGSYSHIFIM
jgi:hypothetical protein